MFGLELSIKGSPWEKDLLYNTGYCIVASSDSHHGILSGTYYSKGKYIRLKKRSSGEWFHHTFRDSVYNKLYIYIYYIILLCIYIYMRESEGVSKIS